MTEQQQAPSPRPSQRKKEHRSLAITVAIALLLSVGAIWYLFFGSVPNGTEHATGPSTSSIENGKVPNTNKAAGSAASPEMSETEWEASVENDRQESQNARSENPLATNTEQPPAAPVIAIRDCPTLASDLATFCKHLDSRDYIKDFELNSSAQDYFIKLADQVLNNPPVVIREEDDLFTILRNMAHFFRILGKKNIVLLKTILNREADSTEDIAASLYQWTVNGSCTTEQFALKLPLDKMYEYAGFFINTMGGRSYLFRRDSRSRLLVNYYSVLIIDQTNKKGMNKYGIDIAPSIDRLIQEIETTTHLVYKESYLDRLDELRDEYNR